jgi:hypothetical protein
MERNNLLFIDVTEMLVTKGTDAAGYTHRVVLLFLGGEKLLIALYAFSPSELTRTL